MRSSCGRILGSPIWWHRVGVGTLGFNFDVVGAAEGAVKSGLGGNTLLCGVLGMRRWLQL